MPIPFKVEPTLEHVMWFSEKYKNHEGVMWDVTLERKTRVPKISLLFSKLKQQKSPETTTDTQDVIKFYWFHE